MEIIIEPYCITGITIYPYEVKKDDMDKLDSADIRPCMIEGCWYGWY